MSDVISRFENFERGNFGLNFPGFSSRPLSDQRREKVESGSLFWGIAVIIPFFLLIFLIAIIVIALVF